MRSRRRGWRLPGAQLQDPGWLPLGSPSLPSSRSCLLLFPEREGWARRAVCPQEGDPAFPGAPLAPVEEHPRGP